MEKSPSWGVNTTLRESRNIPFCYRTRKFITCSQQPATGPCSVAYETNHKPCVIFLYLFIYLRLYFKWSILFGEISGSKSDEYQDECLLGCCVEDSRTIWAMFQRCWLPPSSGWWHYMAQHSKKLPPSDYPKVFVNVVVELTFAFGRFRARISAPKLASQGLPWLFSDLPTNVRILP
jgi:hypothetical protein